MNQIKIIILVLLVMGLTDIRMMYVLAGALGFVYLVLIPLVWAWLTVYKTVLRPFLLKHAPIVVHTLEDS